MHALHRTQLILRQPGFAGLLGAAFALGVGHSFVAPFLSLWGTQEIGLSPLLFGCYTTATTLSGVLAATTLARRSDTHVSRRSLLLLGGASGSCGYIGYALTRDPRLLLVIGCTLLALSTVCFSQLFAHARERFFHAAIPGVPPGFLLSIVRVGFSLAWTAGPAVGAWMMVHHGFRGLFLGTAALFLVFTLGVARFVPAGPQPPAAPREPLRRVLTRGDLLALFAAFVLIFAAHTVNMMNLPLVLTRVLGGSARDVGITFGVGPLAELPLMLWFGLMAGRGQGRQLGLLRFGAAATVLYFVLLTLARAPWQVFPLQILHGMSFAIFSNVAILFVQERLPGQPGLATTVFTNAAHVGNLVGYFGFGLLAEPLGQRGLFWLSAAFAAVTTLILVLYRPAGRPPPVA